MHICCGFGLACLILSSSDLQTVDHGNCRLMDMISILGKMTVSIIKRKISEYMTKDDSGAPASLTCCIMVQISKSMKGNQRT